jgi:surface antigen
MNLLKLAMPAICLLLSACVSDTEDNTAQTDADALNKAAAAQAKAKHDLAESLTGGMLSGAVGKRMDDSDKTQFVQAVSSGKVTEWRNAHTGAQFAVQPAPSHTRRHGENCRDFTIKAIVDGKRQKIYGSACQNNGTWQAMEN